MTTIPGTGPPCPSREPLRVGVLAVTAVNSSAMPGTRELYECALTRLAKLGATLVEIDFAPFRKAGALLYDGAWVAERLAALKTFIAEHEHDMDKSVYAIITGAARLSAVDAFEGQYALAACKRGAEAEWRRMDVLLVPTAPTQYTVEEVNADPIALNRRLGYYTNFVNLLDCAAIAVPAGFRNDSLPFGLTLVAPAFTDMSLAAVADRFHRIEPSGMGVVRSAPMPAHSVIPTTHSHDSIEIFVVGAHLSGMPLNHQLTTLGAVFRCEATTASDYRLFLLRDVEPAKPGLVRMPPFRGPGIPGEIWGVPASRFGSFVAQIPAPLGMGTVTLENGQKINGFLCEAHAVENAVEITDQGGWRRYRREILRVTD